MAEFSTDLSGYQGMLPSGVACKSMHGDAFKWRHIIQVFDLYPLEKVAMKLCGGKGLDAVDFRRHFSLLDR